MSLEQIALEYLSKGISIIPIKGRAYAKGDSEKERIKNSKRPLVNWLDFQSKLAAPDEVKGWFKEWPEANIGAVTGPISNLFVVDLDGEDWKTSIAGKEMRPTWTVKTPRGGFHYYFAWSKFLVGLTTTKSGILPGVDVRGDGGYAILPPSVGYNGTPYTWCEAMSDIDIPKAEVMPWVFDYLPAEYGAESPLRADAPKKTPIETILAGIKDGEGRDDELTRLAGFHHSRLGLSPNLNLAYLRLVNQNFYPPKDDEDLQRIVNSVNRYKVTPVQGNDCAHPREVVSCGIKFKPISLFKLMENPPVREWLVEKYLAKGCLAILAGHPKHGKSTLVYWLIKCVLGGKPFLGFPTKRVNVLILAVEESIEDIIDRFSKSNVTEDMGLYIHCAPLKSTDVELEGIREFIKTNEIGLIVVDTLARFWKVKDESNASEVSAATQPLLELARGTGSVVLLVHHSRKSEGDDGTEIRGSGDILAVADIGLILKKRKGSESQRTLHAHSRYPTPKELIINFENGEFTVLGSANQVRHEEQRKKVMASLSTDFKEAKEIAVTADMTDGTCRTVLNILSGEGLIDRQGEGTRGKAYSYALKSEFNCAQNDSLSRAQSNGSTNHPQDLPPQVALVQQVFGGVVRQ